MLNTTAVKAPTTMPLSKRMRTEEGNWANKLGVTVTPSPKVIEQAAMSMVLESVRSALPNMRIPAAHTIPNIAIIAPPNTDVGIIVAKAANLGTKPNTTSIIPQTTITVVLRTLDNSTSPTFCENVVYGKELKIPPMIEAKPSYK